MHRNLGRTIGVTAASIFLGLFSCLPAPASAQIVSKFSTVTRARSLAVDASGRLYVSSRAPGNVVLRYLPPDSTKTTFATGFSEPVDMVFDDLGNLYVANYTGNRIDKVTPAGVRTAFATVASPGPMVRDAAGNLYVGEYFAEKIDKVTPAGVVSLYLNLASAGGTRLTMLYMDSDGTLYAGMLTGEIFKIGLGGTPVSLFNTSMASVVGFTRGPDGNFYASSYDNEEIFRITPGGVGTLVAGAHLAHGYVNGPALTARFYYPSGMVFLDDKLYIAEYYNNDVRVIDFGFQTNANAKSSWGRLKNLFH